MRSAIIDKRIAGIIRWLERLNKSYSNGKMESALMEAECARADLEDLTQDVWNRVKPAEFRENKFLSRIINFSRVAVLTAIIILLAVFPIAKDIPAPPVVQDKNDIVLAEPVIIIREYEEEEAKSEITPKKAAKTSTVKKTSAKRAQVPQEITESAKPKQNTTTAKTVPYEQVFSLMQTGQKALKNNTSVIKLQ